MPPIPPGCAAWRAGSKCKQTGPPCLIKQDAATFSLISHTSRRLKAGSLKMNTALEYSTRVVQEGVRRCKKSTLNDLVHLAPLRIPLMNPPSGWCCKQWYRIADGREHYSWHILAANTKTAGIGLVQK